ncbi:MAG: glycosyltransferase [Acidimicrobiales bacterium]
MRPDVTLISPFPAPGEIHAGFSGVASYTANLATALADEGAAVHVVAEHLDPAAPDRSRTSEDHGDITVTRAYRRGVGALRDASRAAIDVGAPVTHVQLEMFLYGGPPSLASLPRALTRLRSGGQGPVVTLHQVMAPRSIDQATVALHRVPVPPAGARAGIGGLQQLVGRLAATTIVHEAPFAAHVPDSDVVPHGTERLDPMPRAAARRHLGIDDDRLVVLCFGFLAPYKGLELALGAGELAPDTVQVVVAGGEHPRLAAGGDPYAERLRARHGHHARFTGWVPESDVSPWFAAADLALFPYPEPFSASGSLALALAHRTPVLVSRTLADTIGAPSDLVLHPGPAGLAHQLTDLARDPDALDRVGHWSDVLGQGRTWDAVARRHLDIYQEVTR